MKKIANVLAMVVMLSLSNAWASDWVKLKLPGLIHFQEYYYDIESISCNDNIVKVWVKHVGPNAYDKTFNPNEHIDCTTYLVEINCADKRFTFLEAHQYRYICEERGPAWEKSKVYESPVDFSKGSITYGNPSYTGIGIGVWQPLNEMIGSLVQVQYLFKKICPCRDVVPVRTEQEQKPGSPSPVVPPVVAEKPLTETGTLAQLINEELGLKKTQVNTGSGVYSIKMEIGEGGKYKGWQDATKLGETTKIFPEWLTEQYQNFGQKKLRDLGPEQIRKIDNEIQLARMFESDQNRELERQRREAEKKEEQLTPKKITPIPKRLGESNTRAVPPITSSGWDDGLNEYGIWNMKWGMKETNFEGELLVSERPMNDITVYRNRGAAESGKPSRTIYGVGTPSDNKLYYFRDGKLCAVKMVFIGLGYNNSVDNVLNTLHKKFDGCPKRPGTNCEGLFPAIETTENAGGVLFTSLEWNVGNVSVHFKYWPPLPKLQEGKEYLTTEQKRQPAYAELFYVYHGTKYPQAPYVKPPAKFIKKDGKWVQVPGTGGLAK